MPSDAVIFIPGIKGTKLVETNRSPFDTVWSGIQSNFESIEDLELTLRKGDTYFDAKRDTIIRPGEVEELAYGEFLGDLTAGDRPIFIFNYDWRFSNAESGARLATFIEYLIAKSAATAGLATFKKFDFITHSLGNFVFRNYVHQHGMGKVEKVVLTVPPFAGSLDIVSAALIGEGFFPGVKGKFRKLIRTMPGALELLPSYAGASIYKPSGSHSFFNFNHWQDNVNDVTVPPAAKFKAALAHAKTVASGQLSDLSLLTPAERSRILIIARDGFDTFQTINIVKDHPTEGKNFVDFENACRTDSGDGRVPHASSCIYHASIATLMLQDAFWYKDYSHGFVLKDERVQKLANRFLFGTSPFDPTIRGGSVKRVVGLASVADPKSGLSYMKPVLQ